MNTDILKDRRELKQMPFSVPEGYFDEMRDKVKMTARPAEMERHTYKGTILKISVAAILAAVVTIGLMMFQKTEVEDPFTEEDYIVFSDCMTSTIYEVDIDMYADAYAMTEDDILEYLIYSDYTIEEIEGIQ